MFGFVLQKPSDDVFSVGRAVANLTRTQTKAQIVIFGPSPTCWTTSLRYTGWTTSLTSTGTRTTSTSTAKVSGAQPRSGLSSEDPKTSIMSTKNIFTHST